MKAVVVWVTASRVVTSEAATKALWRVKSMLTMLHALMLVLKPMLCADSDADAVRGRDAQAWKFTRKRLEASGAARVWPPGGTACVGRASSWRFTYAWLCLFAV